MIIIFNLLTLVIPDNFKTFTGIIEVTNGLAFLKISEISTYFKALLSIIFINFGGFCILMQIKTVLSNSKIKVSNYLYGRFYATFLSSSLFLLATLFHII